MPEFSNPFAGVAYGRKLTKEELIRSIRYSVAAEYEAAQLYLQLSDSINDKVSKAVLEDIAEEELVHVGEFLRLLKYLAPKEEESYQKGYKEVEEMIKKVKGKKSYTS